MKQLVVAVDGASRGNPGAAGIGVVIYSDKGDVVKEIGEYIGQTTNNVAEYKAMIRALQEALRLGATDIRVQTDSELLARQVSGIYRVRAPHLAELYYEVKSLFAQFQEARVVHVRRELNAHADRLASDAARRRADYSPEGGAKAAKAAARKRKSPTPKKTSGPAKQQRAEQKAPPTKRTHHQLPLDLD